MSNDMGTTGRRGVLWCGAAFEEIGFVFRNQPIANYGIDAIIEPKGERYLSGKMIAVQIKSGESFLDEGKEDYVVFRGDSTHYNYWINHALPVIVVLHNPLTGEIIWECITRETAIKCKTGWKTNIPRKQVLKDSRDKLFNLAAKQSEFERRWNSLVIAKNWMLETVKQGYLILEVEEWINKSSGRGHFKLLTEEPDEKERVIFDRELLGFGCRNYDLVIQEMFPWADVCVDEEYYEENMDEECCYRNEHRETVHNIYPYANSAGEVDFYRLKLTLNRIGQSFIEIDHFLETGKFYLLDNITV